MRISARTHGRKAGSHSSYIRYAQLHAASDNTMETTMSSESGSDFAFPAQNMIASSAKLTITMNAGLNPNADATFMFSENIVTATVSSNPPMTGRM